jgi:hypothetical protein
MTKAQRHNGAKAEMLTNQQLLASEASAKEASNQQPVTSK